MLRTRLGWVAGVLPSLALIASGVMKLIGGPELEKGFAHLGWPIAVAIPLGIVELLCTVLYLIPATAVLGAILLTGYLGGAIATHVRIGEPFLTQLLLGVIFWLGLYLRDERIRALIPLRSPR